MLAEVFPASSLPPAMPKKGERERCMHICCFLALHWVSAMGPDVSDGRQAVVSLATSCPNPLQREWSPSNTYTALVALINNILDRGSSALCTAKYMVVIMLGG